MEVQPAADGRGAYARAAAAGPILLDVFAQAGVGQQGVELRRQHAVAVGTAPAEHAAQVARPGVFRAAVDAPVGGRGDGGEAVILAEQLAAEGGEGGRGAQVQGHGASMTSPAQRLRAKAYIMAGKV